ncbi:BON domain-containing protein [Schlesneria sp. DSM 10557]|uniref:BON domain-containing protein n=1 Tax=Schlesneria sp. DSM 10557 TaxID=3044399 RepID=UPI0035A1A1FA
MSVSPVSRVEEDLTEFGLHYPEGSNEEGVRIGQLSTPVIRPLRRSLIGLGDSNDYGCDDALTTNLQQTLAKSSYGLARVQCVVSPSEVHLFGTVKTYFAVQMAIQLARGTAATRRIKLDIDVVPKLYEIHTCPPTEGRAGLLPSVGGAEFHNEI